MSTERVKINEGLYLIKSKFGWTIFGKHTRSCMDRFRMCPELVDQQKAFICLCSKQNYRNQQRKRY